MQEGLIIKGIGGFYYLKSGENIYECKPRGIMRKEQIQPVPGDRVRFSVVEKEKNTGVIEEICKRKNFFIRPQIANVDQVILIFAVRHPDPDFLLLDKLLIKMLSMNIKPIICINKMDLDEDKKYAEQFNAYLKLGLTIIFITASKNMGVAELKEKFKGNLTILAGPSGVGKSTLVNKLHPNENIEVGDLSRKLERGKHTTRHVELFEVAEGGYIADTPGFSSFDIDDIKSSQLQMYYPEFNKFKEYCRFNGCSHLSEPSCAVKDAVSSNQIDGGRYERYNNIYAHLKQNERNKY